MYSIIGNLFQSNKSKKAFNGKIGTLIISLISPNPLSIGLFKLDVP